MLGVKALGAMLRVRTLGFLGLGLRALGLGPKQVSRVFIDPSPLTSPRPLKPLNLKHKTLNSIQT